MIRKLPILVIVLLAYSALPEYGIRLDKLQSFVASLAIYAPGSYRFLRCREAGRAIGLTRLQTSLLRAAPLSRAISYFSPVRGRSESTAPTGQAVSVVTRPIEDGYEDARLTGLNLLAVAKSPLGELSRIEAVVKLLGMVAPNQTSPTI